MKTKTKIYVDVGSSTVKVYQYNGELKLAFSKSIPFKAEFDAEKGISQNCKDQLWGVFGEIKQKYGDISIKVLATAVYRKMNEQMQKEFAEEFFSKTGCVFTIISQELESHYLEVALTGKCDLEEPVLLINIGGGSTELVVMKGQKAVEKLNIEIGVGTILVEFKEINMPISGVKIDDVKKWVRAKLSRLNRNVKTAIYTGGELRYMQLAGYKLMRNELFEDNDHPSLITVDDFGKRNKEIFEKVTVEELEKLMPENPSWMHGARGCGVIAEAICEYCGIEDIIPSNSNMIDGAVREEEKYLK